MVKIDMYYKDKTVLVTGGAGSVGSALVKKLLTLDPKAVRVLDNNETGLFDLAQDHPSDRLRLLVGDIRDKERLERAFEDVDIIFHAAALKHVPLCEFNPFDAVKTNVVGTKNVIDVALNTGVKKVILISTDKAVNPSNVMGATKLLAERLMISSNYYKGKRNIALSCVRFGNVLGSRGSIIPIFKKQIANEGDVTVTDPEMTRFVMSIPKATELILRAAEQAQGGEIFILKMPSLRIIDLAKVMIEEIAPNRNKKITFIGVRAGEKLDEELITDTERSCVYENNYLYMILPHERWGFGEQKYDLSKFHKIDGIKYSSRDNNPMTREEICSLLKDLECE